MPVALQRSDPDTGHLLDRRKLSGLRKLGVTYRQLLEAPPISEHWNRFAWRRQISGHPIHWLYYLRMSESPEARLVLDKVSLVAEDARSRLPMEAFALAAGVNPWRLYESLTGAAMRSEAQAGAFLIAISQEDILAALIERAKDPSEAGDKAREQFLRMSGYMPLPKSAQTNITVVQQNANAAAAPPAANLTPPSPEDVVRGLTEDHQARLPPALPPAIDISVEADSDALLDEDTL